MSNFRVDTRWPWLHFEPPTDSSGIRMHGNDSQSDGFDPLSFAYGATPAKSDEGVGLSNWRPPGALTGPQPEPRPWWLFGKEPDPTSPWLHVQPQDNPPGFRVAPNGSAASVPTGNGTAPSLGWNVGPNASVVGRPFAHQSWVTEPPEETQPLWLRVQGQGDRLEDQSDPRWPWLRAEPMDERPSLGAAPDVPVSPVETGNSTAFGFNWQTPDVGPTTPFAGGLFAQHDVPTESSAEPQPWWSGPSGQGERIDGRPGLRWPWLRTEQTDELAALRMDRDGLEDQSKSGDFNPMSFAYQPFDRLALENVDVNGTEPQVGAASTPLSPSRQPGDADGVTATSVVLPMAPAMAASEAARAALAKAAALAGRVAPAVPRISPSGLALSFLVPTNAPSEIIELDEVLRARINPGQRSVEIERRADNGLVGTGIGARWEILPINAELHVGADGARSVLFDQQQLARAVGPEAAARAWDAIGSAMARPPKKREDEAQQPSTESRSSQTPNPGGGSKPPLGSGPLTTAAEVASQVLEHANKPRTDAQEQAQLIEGWRQILKARGEQAPDGQYRGERGYMTALGVRMPLDVGDPAVGREAFPEQEHLRKALIGEFELVNRIRTVRPDEIIVHFGNAPGAQGPDVLSIGRDRLINVWDSKSRSGERSVGPSMAASANLDRRKIEAYVWKAVNEGRLSREVALEALKKFYDGNYNILTVGTGNAHDGLVESFRRRKSSGPRRH